MGWKSKGKLLVPDESTEVPLEQKGKELVSPSGLVVKQMVANTPVELPAKIPRQARRFIEQLKKKQARRSNREFLADRFSYLRKSAPKNVHTSES